MLYQGIIGGGSSPVEPVDLSPVLLWENPSPTNEFAGQKISLDLTNYVGIIIELRTATSISELASRSYIKVGEKLEGATASDGSSSFSGWRTIQVESDGVTLSAKAGGSTVNDRVGIPTKIYGVKEYVVDSNLSTEIVPSDYVNFNASTGFTAVVGTYYAVVQASDSNADPTFNGATILKTGFNQRISSSDRAYLSIIKATSTTITSNKNGTYCTLNLE